MIFVLTTLSIFGYFAYRFAERRWRGSRSGEAPDIVIESVELDPPDGSTLTEQTPVMVTIEFRFTSPRSNIGVWARIFDETYRTQYFGFADRYGPGRHRVVRGAYLTEAGTLKTLTIVFKNAKSAEIFRQDIPVHYTYVANPALESQKQDGIGSTISNVTFPKGRTATVKAGTFIPVVFDYSVTTVNGLYAGTVPDTRCSITYAGMAEPLLGDGSMAMGFTVGEPCLIKRVKVSMRNEAEGYVFEEYVDVDLTIV